MIHEWLNLTVVGLLFDFSGAVLLIVPETSAH